MATVAMTFVSKLYEVMSIEEYVHIIAWDTSGKHIYILDQEGFVQVARNMEQGRKDDLCQRIDRIQRERDQERRKFRWIRWGKPLQAEIAEDETQEKGSKD